MRESDRIKSVAKHYGSQQKFATLLGTTQSNVANWIQRGSLSSKAIKMIASKCPEISLDWLTTGKGNMIIDTPGHADYDLKINKLMAAAKSARNPIEKKAYTREIIRLVRKRQAQAISDGSRRKVRIQRASAAYAPTDTAFNSLVNISPSVNYSNTVSVTSIIENRKKAKKQSLGQREINSKLKEAAERYSEVCVKDGNMEIKPEVITAETKLAVVPVPREAEAYVKVSKASMAPTINEGDVIGITSTDWFETFSQDRIYLLTLSTGEMLLRRIVPPEDNEEGNIKLVSDNPEEEMIVPRKDIKQIKRVIYIGKNIF